MTWTPCMFTKLDTIRYAISFRSVFSLWFHGTRYILIITRDGRVKFLVASGCLERVKQTMPWIKDFEPFPFVMAHGLGIVEKAFKDLGLTKAKVGLDLLPFNVLSGMVAGPSSRRVRRRLSSHRGRKAPETPRRDQGHTVGRRGRRHRHGEGSVPH